MSDPVSDPVSDLGSREPVVEGSGPEPGAEPRRAGMVSTFKVMERHRGLDECLEEPALRRWAFHPQLFPDFVRLEELAAIEQLNTSSVS